MPDYKQKTAPQSARGRNLRSGLLILLNGLAAFAAIVLICGTETQSGGTRNPPPTTICEAVHRGAPQSANV